MRLPGKPIRKGMLFALWVCAAFFSDGEHRVVAAAELPIQGAVYHVHRPDGSHKTYLDVMVGGSFTGRLPEDIDSITVISPSGRLAIGKTDFRYNPQWRAFWIVLPGIPEIGTYTFKLVSGDDIGVATDTQSNIATIPIPDVRRFDPARAVTVACRTPVFSWSLLNAPGPFYYQLEIRDTDRRHVYRTDFVKDMASCRLPPGLLEPGLRYQWRIRVIDDADWIAMNNRSQSKWVTVYNRRDGKPCPYRYAAPPQIDDGWTPSSLSAEGIDAGKISALMQRIVNAEIANIHSVLIVKNGKLVLEEYFYGNHRNRPHHLMSVSKSITSILIGIAIDRQKIRGTKQQMAGFFPSYADLLQQERKKQIRLHHVLTMTAGLDWNAWTFPDEDLRNTTTAMVQSDDWIRFVLARDAVDPPGTRYVYSNGLTMLLGEILRTATGVYADQFAERVLFDPLGISDYYWHKSTDGRINTAGGLWLKSRDMAKIGIMMLHGGRWKDKQVVSAAWVRESTKAHVQKEILLGGGYGYQWWRGRVVIGRKKLELFYAAGKGGQYIFVCPALDLVTVVTSEPYNDSMGEFRPQMMMIQQILPAMLPTPLPRKTTALDDKTAQEVAGDYRFHLLQLPVTILKEGNRLYFDSPDDEKMPLFAETQTRFFGTSSQIGDFQGTFYRNKKGQISHFVVQIGFGFWRFDRIHK